MKRTISVKKFIAEYGENFSEHMKERLMDLEVRCVLTRSQKSYRLDLKHVEHTQHDCKFQDSPNTCQKEYAYGQLAAIDGNLYYSDESVENDKTVQSPIVNTIYNSLSSKDMIFDSDSNVKKVDDSNIDYVIDTILTVCPTVSQSYMDIMGKYLK